MRFYAVDKPDKLLRVDMVHRYTHVVRDGDMVITFQKSYKKAEEVMKMLYSERLKYIELLERALRFDSEDAAVRNIKKQYGSSGLIHGALIRQKRQLQNIKIVELIVKE